MRNQYISVLILLVGLNAHAQSEQYKRTNKRSTTPSVANPSGAAAPAAKASKKSDLKVDLQDLEQQYWTPQDTEFKVVQNRKFSKDGKYALSLQLGPLVNDDYAEGSAILGVTLGYYFTEFSGVELNYTNYSVKESTVVTSFIDQFGGVRPDHNLPVSYIGASYNWIPIYGKMSILDKKIIYFDLAISPGLGLMKYEQKTDPTSASVTHHGEEKSSFVLALDISQHFFFSEKIAFRVDMKNRYYKQDILKYNTGEAARSSSKTSTLWQVGFTYYFGKGKSPAVNLDGGSR